LCAMRLEKGRGRRPRFPLGVTGTRRSSFALHVGNANFPASRRRFRLKMNCHGFPKACDHKYLFNRRLDRFDHRIDRFGHRLSERCSALGCINTLGDWSTFKSAAGTVPNSYPHSRACIKSNTHSYVDSEPDTITKSSTCRNASPTFTPPQIALHPVQVIRVCEEAGNVIESHDRAGDFKLTANFCIARCSSRNAIRISSARTMKRSFSRPGSTARNISPLGLRDNAITLRRTERERSAAS